MLGGLYERIANRPGGGRGLASARLRRRVLVLLHQALEGSGLSQSLLGEKLGIRRSAVNQVFRGDGNVRIDTLADYLYEMGYELDLQVVGAGEHRRAHEEGREVRPRRHVQLPPSSSNVKPLLISVPRQGIFVCPASSVRYEEPVITNAFLLSGQNSMGVVA